MAPVQIKVVYDYYSAKRTTPFFITEEELLNLDFHSFIKESTSAGGSAHSKINISKGASIDHERREPEV